MLGKQWGVQHSIHMCRATLAAIMAIVILENCICITIQENLPTIHQWELHMPKMKKTTTPGHA